MRSDKLEKERIRRSRELYLQEERPAIKPEYQDRYEIFWDRNRFVQRRKDVERYNVKYVQSFISNIATPRSLEELKYFIEAFGEYNVEMLFHEKETIWTVPSVSKPGDIVFFMHAKSAKDYLTQLRRDLKKNETLYSPEMIKTMYEWINRGIEIHSKVGGKIFAIAKICGYPSPDPEHVDLFHWGSHLYAEMNQVTVLANTIHVDTFKEVTPIEMRTGITPVFGEGFYRIRELIKEKNVIPEYLEISDATPIPYSRINRETWLSISNEYRRNFSLEKMFRAYYVDYLLELLGDQKKIFKECECMKAGITPSYIDNVIYLNKKYLPVEIKLSVPAQQDIKAQVRKYCYDQEILLETTYKEDIEKERWISGRKVYGRYCLVIDTEKVYMFDFDSDELAEIYDLDYLKTFDDIHVLRNIINTILEK